MSFYLDDYPDDDRQASDTCPNCGGTSFYNDPSGALVCSSCFTQSQIATQEELDYDEGFALAAKGIGVKKRAVGGGGKRGVPARPLKEYDRSKRLPDAEDCCLAFQWLLREAAKCVSKLAGIEEHNSGHYPEENEEPTRMERTVEKIWFAYLNAWREAAREYSAKYPEMRASFRDYFLEIRRKGYVLGHLSIQVGRRVEEEILEDLQRKEREDDGEGDESTVGMGSVYSSANDTVDESEADSASRSSRRSSKRRKKTRHPVLTIAALCQHKLHLDKANRHPNGLYQMHPHHAALWIQPSLTFLLSILQLALTHLRTGVAPHHLTMWTASGQLPHALNGYELLPSKLKERIELVKRFFERSFVPPAGSVADLTGLLATACNWYSDGVAAIPTPDVCVSDAASLTPQRGSRSLPRNEDVDATRHQRSLYNVPLLAARLVQDLGFEQRVLDNALALMSIESKDGDSQEESTTTHPLPPLLVGAGTDKLFTPLHVAAVIVVACKLCPGWKTWQIANLHSGKDETSTESNLATKAFVPWNEAQFQQLGNGPTLTHYINFLEDTAFKGVEPSNDVTQYFQSLETGLHSLSSQKKDGGSEEAPQKRSPGVEKVAPNRILAGNPNPNEQPPDTRKVNAKDQYTIYTYRMHSSGKILDTRPYHPHYCRLIEYICYTIEETKPQRLHEMVEELEDELLSRLEPTEEAWARLRDPLRWACDSCHSTDGIWCCLRCGHIGCGRRAHLPALGGGHSKHHFHTTHSLGSEDSSSSQSGDDGKKKRAKIFRRILRSYPSGKKCSRNSDSADDEKSGESDDNDFSLSGGHFVCIDIVSKAVHCYACDDYVLSDAPWLANLREELNEIELRRDNAMDVASPTPSTDDELERQGSMEAEYEMVERPEEEDAKLPAVEETNEGTTKEQDELKVAPQSSSFEPGITGLDNLGNTCYMNSVVQMLSHCSGFRSFFRDFLRAAAPLRLAGEGGYTLARQSTTRLKKALHEDESPEELALTEATHALLRVLWSGRWRSIAPRYFVNAVWKHSILFAAKRQQDANEFLNWYLGRVDDELKPAKATNSVMLDLFGVNQYQEVQCDECNTVTKRTEPMLGLVLSIPSGDSERESRKNGVNLHECFKSLQTTGRFEGENQFDCDECQGKKDAEWRVTLQRRPQSLLISLRRTQWSKEKGLHKDSRRVIFPVELDASQLIGMKEDRSIDDDFEGCHYRLVACVSHSGSSPFVGHYFVYIQVSADKWFLFNDSSVTPATEASVLDAEAFILLYERQTIPSVE
ncbi:hypothetical protein ACHAXT_006381 [Thalassiosira profunda]